LFLIEEIFWVFDQDVARFGSLAGTDNAGHLKLIEYSCAPGVPYREPPLQK
jgi:hypothetical protein